MAQTAVVLGGTTDHIALIKLLKSQGYHTVLVDYFDEPPAKQYAHKHVRESTLNEEAVLSIAEKLKAKLVVAACIDQALVTMAYVCQKMNLPCHLSYERALEITNKVMMKEKFEQRGIPTTKFVEIKEDDFSQVSKLKFPVIVKPTNSNSSKGIAKISSADGLISAVGEAKAASRTGEVIVEEFFEGIEFSVDAIVNKNKAKIILITETEKNQLNPQNFTITKSVYSPLKDETIKSDIQTVVQKIAEAYCIEDGPLLVQLLYKGGQIKVVEFSSRIGGGSKHAFIKQLTGFDMLEYFMAVLQKKPYTRAINQNYKYGTMVYIYTKGGVVAGFSGFNELLESSIIDGVFYYKTPGSVVLGSRSSNDRVAGMLLLDNNETSLYKRIDLAMKAVQVTDENGQNTVLDSINGFTISDMNKLTLQGKSTR